MSTVVFQASLNGGIEYRIHQAQSFSNHSEIAIEIGGKFVSVVSVETKKTGVIECKTIESGKVRIQGKVKAGEPVVVTRSGTASLDLSETSQTDPS